ncbi:AAA family ATPase [Pendulispora albinea]|uniref:MoxR family ATPase n=1 Tax=Pendulispora albinea TaxID=2741071 RepID=A0ABZ2LLF3_9BACT
MSKSTESRSAPQTIFNTELAGSPAAQRFVAFFDELKAAFLERDDLFHQISLALLAREHVLMTGPPGTAKSAIASAVLGRIVDERTRVPSVFARQFTESTVQTDIVGPVDFKTLMQTGRTEHFTDEGMLGAAHAFLDEVLDGRDMLLRTTLNILHERELKQGSMTTKGIIECALMTTNRYLSEVLEGSRETLLAFIDRIAFIAFVPKGFAESSHFTQVLRSQVGGAGRPRLKAVLTLQDLDVLQAAVDQVYVPDEVCDAMGQLLESLDTEFSAAARSDPSFSPTRYLSTRTAVRLGRVLRAAVILRRITEGGPEEATFEDLPMLGYSLLLCGPGRGSVAQLLSRETDARERRQLSIMRTEGSIFDAALARLPKAATKPLPVNDGASLERAVPRLKPDDPPEKLLQRMEELAQKADAGGRDGERATSLLNETWVALEARALEMGLSGGAGSAPVDDVVRELSDLARRLERASGNARPTALWLRGRAIALLEENGALAFGKVGAWLDTGGAKVRAVESSDQLLAALEGLSAECARLRAEGADEAPRAPDAPPPLQRAVERVEDELVIAWNAELQNAVAGTFAALTSDRLGALIDALEPHLKQIDQTGARLQALGAEPGGFKSRVLGPRVRPLLEAAFERLDVSDRLAVVERTSAQMARLESVGLGRVLTPIEWLTLVTKVLVRTERPLREDEARAPSPDQRGYRALRQAEQRVSLTYTLVGTAFRVVREAHLDELHTNLAELPAAMREGVIDRDLARIDRALSLLERFWEALRAPTEAACASGEAGALGAALESVRQSGFFHIAHDEGALARFALEARLLGETFPAASERTAALRGRIDALEARSRELLARLRRAHADTRWAGILAPERS